MRANEKSKKEEPEGSYSLIAEPEEPPLIGLCGEITEEAVQQIGLALLSYNGGRILDPDKEQFEDAEDIEFFISSGGGSVNEMLAIYDLMQVVKENRDIATCGFGKISSAAVLLLAAGTKGKRHVGRHTRLMLHHCSSNVGGSHPDVKSNFNEMKEVEDMMVRLIATHSNLSTGEIYNIISRNTDEYFSAEEALEMGLVDKII